MDLAPKFLDAKSVLNNLDHHELLMHCKELIYDNMREKSYSPLRELVKLENPLRYMSAMPSFSESLRIFTTKVASFIDYPAGDPRNRVEATVVVNSIETGKVIAIIDGNLITNLKCIVLSSIVTDFCARNDAKVATIFGSGVQAFNQVVTLCNVRDIQKINVVSRTKENLRRFENKVTSFRQFKNINFSYTTQAQSLAQSDIVSTTTTTAVPLIKLSDINKDIHINAIGAHTKETREVSPSILSNSHVIVEDRETAMNEAGTSHSQAMDFEDLLKKDENKLKHSLTLFASVGNGFYDLLVAHYLVRKFELLK